MFIRPARLAAIMEETGMDAFQATSHLRQRDKLHAMKRRNPRRFGATNWIK